MNQIDEIIQKETEKRRQKTALRYNPKRVLYKRTCEICGQEFISNRNDTRYCSARCRHVGWVRDQEAKREREEARQEKQKKELDLYRSIIDDVALLSKNKTLKQLMEKDAVTKYHLERIFAIFGFESDKPTTSSKPKK